MKDALKEVGCFENLSKPELTSKNKAAKDDEEDDDGSNGEVLHRENLSSLPLYKKGQQRQLNNSFIFTDTSKQ